MIPCLPCDNNCCHFLGYISKPEAETLLKQLQMGRENEAGSKEIYDIFRGIKCHEIKKQYRIKSWWWRKMPYRVSSLFSAETEIKWEKNHHSIQLRSFAGQASAKAAHRSTTVMSEELKWSQHFWSTLSKVEVKISVGWVYSDHVGHTKTLDFTPSDMEVTGEFDGVNYMTWFQL